MYPSRKTLSPSFCRNRRLTQPPGEPTFQCPRPTTQSAREPPLQSFSRRIPGPQMPFYFPAVMDSATTKGLCLQGYGSLKTFGHISRNAVWIPAGTTAIPSVEEQPTQPPQLACQKARSKSLVGGLQIATNFTQGPTTSVASNSHKKSIEISARPLGNDPSAANLGQIFIGESTKLLAWGAESVRFAYRRSVGCEVPHNQVELSHIFPRGMRKKLYNQNYWRIA